MITITRFLVLIITLTFTNFYGQEFQGIATYKTSRKLDIKLDSTQMNSEMHERMMQMLKKQFQKTYNLTFNKESSIYKEEESLDAPRVGGGMEVMMVSSGGSDILYKNTKENRFTNQNEVFGKIFLIKDSLQNQNWTLVNETKNIGEYTCFKATYTTEIEVRESGISINGDKDLSKDEVKTKEQIVTAWYTPQIPVNNGPEKFQGLPGLILEINDGQQTIVCSKIVLNPENKSAIEEPTKGKEVNQAEFDVILESKLKEMQERYRPRNNGDGETIEIRIGG